MTSSKSNSSVGLDRFAVFLSGLCLIHCLAVPFALVLGPLAGDWLIESETQVHWILLALASPISALALWRGYRNHHARTTLSLGCIGLVLMFFGVSHFIGEDWEVLLTATGVSALMIAHIRNILGNHAPH